MLGSPRSTTTKILQRSIPSCVHISFKTLFICDFSIHPYRHICMHAHMHIYWWFEFFPRICINTKTNTYMCVVFFMFSRIHIQKTEVLSVRFPKEYDHKHLAAKHPKLCTYFIQNSVYLWFFHTSIHTYMLHAHMHIYWWFEFFQRYVQIQKIYIYIHVCVVCFFDVFWKSYSKSRGSKC